jgi:hypothetical protein
VATVEIEVFSLRAGTTRETFLAVNDAYQAWSYVHRPGLARRTVAFEGDSWLVNSFWASRKQAENEPSDAVPEVAAWCAAIDDSSYRRRLFKTLG